MKNCPHCGKEIQDQAVKCRWCKSFLEKKNTNQSFQRALLLLMGIFFVTIMVIILASALTEDKTQIGANVQDKKYTREEFTNLLLSKTPEEVISLIGRPDSTQGLSGCIPDCNWYYKQQTYDVISGKVDYQAQVCFSYGLVRNINF